MEVTTVKIRDSTKMALDGMKKDRESYDEVIERLIAQIKNKSLKKELIEGYKSMGKEDLELLEEWDSISAEIDDE